jgi:hypothetical protein
MDGKEKQGAFSEAIAALRTRPLSAMFRLKCRWLGTVMDTTALRARGWRPVTATRNGNCLWEGCLWFEKRLAKDGEAIVAQVATSPFMRWTKDHDENPRMVADGDETRRRLGGTTPEFAFLRTVRFFRDEDGGVRRTACAGNERDAAVLEADFGECGEPMRETFLEDLGSQTHGLETELPRGVYPSSFNMSMGVLSSVLAKMRRQKMPHGDERQLVRMIRALAEPEYDPAGREELAGYTDGLTLSQLLGTWWCIPGHDPAGAHLLAYALERADSELATPFLGMAWCMLSWWLREEGLFREAVFAAERALDWPDADERHARELWGAIEDYLRDRFGKERPGEDGKLGWLLRILHEREEALEKMDGYWTLRGLALAVNGNDNDTAMEAIRKDFNKDGPPHLTSPRAWQAFMCAFQESEWGTRRALGAFPEAMLARTVEPFELAQTPIEGLENADFLDAVLEPPENEGGYGLELPTDILSDPREESRWRWVDIPEAVLSSKGIIGATKLHRIAEEGREVELLWILCGTRADDSADVAAIRLLPLPNPGTRNIHGAIWEMFPYRDNGCGELRFRLDNGRCLTAVSSFFANDRHYLRRGSPDPAYLYALPVSIRHAPFRKPAVMFDGKTVEMNGMRVLFRHPCKDSHALYNFSGEVRAVRRVMVAKGGEILCLDLDMGERLPCLLPVYVRESMFEDGPVRVGDMLEGMLILHIDFFPSDERTKAWLDEHPDGPGEEPKEEEPRGELTSFRKSSPDGMVEIPVLGEEPGKTVKVEDDAPTPESMDEVRAAAGKMRLVADGGVCELWLPNPEGIDLAASVGGDVHHYRVLKVMEDEQPAVDLPEGVEPLVVRIRDAGKMYGVEYEGFPDRDDLQLD